MVSYEVSDFDSIFSFSDIPFQIQAGAAGLIGAANVFVFGTVYSYFIFFAKDDEDSDWTGF